MTNLNIKNRHLPHWTFDDSSYFITFRTLKHIKLNDKSIQIALSHIKEGNKKYYHLLSTVILDDHTHIILRPNDNLKLSSIMKGIKGVSAHKINIYNNSTGSIWQDESYDRIIRNQKELNETVMYMYNNPIKRGIVEYTENYIGWYLNPDYDYYEDGFDDSILDSK